MNNNTNDKYPFIKNIYYPGKLLHADDFIHEQEYSNYKYEFLIKTFLGSGIVNGMEVVMQDSNTFVLDKGIGIDESGRPIIVPESTSIKLSEFMKGAVSEELYAILGIEYAEKTSEVEFCVLEDTVEKYRAGRMEETYMLSLHSIEEWEKRKRKEQEIRKIFFDSWTVFENEKVKIWIEVPHIVPIGSSFIIRIISEGKKDGAVDLKYKGLLRLQGGRFSGDECSYIQFQEERKIGALENVLIIPAHANTEEGIPIYLKAGLEEIIIDGFYYESNNRHQIEIIKTAEYEEKLNLLLSKKEEEECNVCWIPLAKFLFEKTDAVGIEETKYHIRNVETKGIRQYTVNPKREGILKRISIDSGINRVNAPGEIPVHPFFPPYPPEPPRPPFPVPPDPFPVNRGLSEEQVKELIEQERDAHIKRGIAILKIPNWYRKGKTLYSDEIQHGFKDNEVIIWYGRMWEARNYAFWEPDRKHHMITQGREALFRDKEETGWQIEEQAVMLNREEGSFRMAVTLKKRRKRGREKEIVVSWIAVRTT